MRNNPKFRVALLVTAVVGVLIGLWLGAGGPRLTMVNEGLRVSYPWSRGGGALLVSVAFMALAAVFSKPWLRVSAGIVAALGLWSGIERLTYSLDTTTAGIVSRAHLVSHQIPWREVVDVGIDLTEITVAGPGHSQIRIDTTDFTAEQMAALNRTIARRVSESSAMARAH